MPLNIPLHVVDTLKRLNPNVLDTSLSRKSYSKIDLSTTNPDLQKFNVSSSKELGEYVFGQLKENKSKVGFGGYLEKRGIYQRSEHFKHTQLEERNIHLGVDFWCKEGTSVLAAWEGKLHSYQNNEGYGNYGPTIILSHMIEGFSFYTLYGHLSVESLIGLNDGDSIEQGAVIGKLGSAKVNGDYPPHLHFQIILDLEDNYGDYPGVCEQSKLDFYKSNCPNPNMLLGLEK
ncbi:peptidoglycan DD-metalloendopeptidase family protein [Aegicerativicinus sediminis]|uniref:peptidoglycan DD-metalloendopeptidase family protein n=1 Tax=Aegicerativicinus sediminis TaxID=2893202 RepID=UPI001E59003F|nr:peptidoglycan DD-metalloendopeptidase family protein [Aegicerativicinus sediminis]